MLEFVVMVGIDVAAGDKVPREFTWLINGKPGFKILNPKSNELRVLHWGETDFPQKLHFVDRDFVVARFQPTMVDKYDDLMGFLFLQIPRSYWTDSDEEEEELQLRFDVFGESAGERTWFMVFEFAVVPSISVRNAPALVRRPRIVGDSSDESTDCDSIEHEQLVLVTILFLEESAEGDLLFKSETGDIELSEKFTLVRGSNCLEFRVPAVTCETGFKFQLRIGEETLVESLFMLKPVRPIEIYLVHHTHVDIGYTHLQEEVEKKQWEHLEDALWFAEESAENEEGARFVWHPEANWAVESYLKNHPLDKQLLLIKGIRNGWIELGCFFANQLCGMYTSEGLMRSLECSLRLQQESSIQPMTEIVSDVPGCPWGVAASLALHGVRYFSMGPNLRHRVGSILEHLGDRPFYWESPSGKNRVLTWVGGAGYAWFHDGEQSLSMKGLKYVNEERIFKYCDQLLEKEYPYDITCLRYCIGTDNGPPDCRLIDAVRSWNARYASPRLSISGATRFFQMFEERYGDVLPTRRGDLTGYWEDGAASSARETALVRRTSELLLQVETLATLLRFSFPPDELYQAWNKVNLFFEHTWGAWNSISDPTSDLAVQQWERKKSFAEDATERAEALRASIQAQGGSFSSPSTTCFDVFNTTNWDRSEIVFLPERDGLVCDDGGTQILSQRLITGELALVAEGVPAFGSRRFQLVDALPSDVAPSSVDSTVSVSLSVLENDHVRIEIDPETGTISSLVNRLGQRDFVDVSGGHGLNQYLYVGSRNPEDVSSAVSDVRIRIMEQGPLIGSIEVSAVASGVQGRIFSEIRIFKGSPHVEIVNTFNKALVQEPEAVLFRFPFLVAKEPEVRVDIPWGSFRVETDQIPGSSKNYLNIQRWVDVHDADGGIALVSIDVPMIQIGEIRTDPIVSGWVDHLEPSGVVYSYVMNNYWETNYCSAQEGPCTFRYTLCPHLEFDEAMVERFAIGCARPLLVFPRDKEEEGLSVKLPFRIATERCIVTLLQEIEDNVFIVRVYNPAGSRESVKVVNSQPEITFISLFRSDVRFRRGEELEMAFSLDSKEISTLRMEVS